MGLLLLAALALGFAINPTRAASPEPSNPSPPAGESPVLTTAAAVRAAGTIPQGRPTPVRLTGTITTSVRHQNLLFFVDATGALYLEARSLTTYPVLGDVVEIQGTALSGGYSNFFSVDDLRIVGHTDPPPPAAIPPAELWSGSHDAAWAILRAHVLDVRPAARAITYVAAAGNRTLEVVYFGPTNGIPALTPGSRIETVGSIGVSTDAQRAINVIRHVVTHAEHFRILAPAATVLQNAASVSLDKLRSGTEPIPDQPVRIQGVVTAADAPGRAFWMEATSDNKPGVRPAIRCTVRGQTPPAVGTAVEAVGLVLSDGPAPHLATIELTSHGTREPPVPTQVRARDLFQWQAEGKLVSVDATFVHRLQSRRSLRIVVAGDDRTFEADLPAPAGPPPGDAGLVPGSIVRLAGVLDLSRSSADGPPVPFLRLRPEGGLRVIAPPPWPLRRTLAVVSTLSVALALGFVALLANQRRLRHVHARLEKANATVHQLNVELEGRVAQRTAELADRESRLRDAQAIARVGSFSWNPRTGESRWSDELHRILDVPPTPHPPGPGSPFDQVHPEDRPALMPRIQAALDQGTELLHECRTRPIDETPRWIAIRARPVRGPGGRSEGLEGTCQDISEQRLAELELVASEQRFTRIFHGAPMASVLAQLNPLLIVEVNDGFVEMFGYARDELVGRSCKELNLWEDPAQRERAMAVVLEKGTLRGFEMRFRRKDGSLGSARCNIDLIRIAGEDFALYLLEDVTERLALESQLLQARKREALGTLSGGIAHDFNNILGAILGHAELARTDASFPGAPATLPESLDEIVAAGRRGRDLIRRMLAFSRPQPPQRNRLRLQDLAAETLRLLRAALPSTTVVRTHFAPTTPCVSADPTQLQQVLINLITNSAQALPHAHGWIEVRIEPTPATSRLSQLQPAFSQHPELVRLTVADNGSGIAADTLPRIFEPFFTTKTVGEGSGLGLSVVHGIVQAHGGTIDVESQPGAGTRFVIHLAPAAADPNTPAESAPAEGQTHPWRVLLVDDEPSLANATAKLLGRAGLVVTTVLDPREALDLFRSRPADFDVVVTDFTMPQIDGLQLGREIQRIQPGQPIILCSGFATRLGRGEARAAGFAEVLIKPVDPQLLRDTIRKAATHRGQPRGPGGDSTGS